MRILILLMCLCFMGCDRMTENMKRGTPGTENYIAEDYRPVTIIKIHEGEVIEVKGGTAIIHPHTIVEDDRGRRYKLSGAVGKVGDKFVKDVSLDTEI